ncbi:hypothetical protein FW774_16215 [Pedobacter sp. BS3]|uniref:hypothetical protein n=1 Tax=Pedobacter sp. BS3 TaxID=2567937 RepID=UPI0011EFD00A|nr:hypothetical protein [Pedobacter sp. BS3]TZF82230.1 hypothetical protein FW774_16215 [Pedobacter sp. BS3]
MAVIISLIRYTFLKQLYRALKSANHTFTATRNAITITSGKYKGISLIFHRDNRCTVSCGQFSFCADMTMRFSFDALVRLLRQHHMIPAYDAELLQGEWIT